MTDTKKKELDLLKCSGKIFLLLLSMVQLILRHDTSKFIIIENDNSCLLYNKKDYFELNVSFHGGWNWLNFANQIKDDKINTTNNMDGISIHLS